MVRCVECKKNFLVTSDLDIFRTPLKHKTAGNHRIAWKDREISVEQLMILHLLEEQEAGLDEDLNPDSSSFDSHEIPCFLCDTIDFEPAICPACNVPLCHGCIDDHNDLLFSLEPI